jgi:YesN/AraC family two-component response regulator
MPVMNGLDAARVLKQEMPNVTLIMFIEYSDIFSKAGSTLFRYFRVSIKV